MDLDRDGRTDVISGSWPGDIYFFRRNEDGSFAPGRPLRDRHGQALNVGNGSAPFAVDWDSHGTLDLLIGTFLGEVYLIPNEGLGKELVFGTPRRLEAAGQPLKVSGDAAPVAADWDGDGRLDLIVGAADGSVVWFRNVGTPREPRLEAARTLIGPSPLGWGSDDQRQEKDWGIRVKPCLVDWDGDGRLDILLGDRCGSFRAKPSQTEQEEAEERRANDQLPELRTRWAAAYREYRRWLDAPPADTPAAQQDREDRLTAAREQLRRLKEEIVGVQEIQSRYQPGNQSHGFVWLFLRKPAAKAHPGKDGAP